MGKLRTQPSQGALRTHREPSFPKPTSNYRAPTRVIPSKQPPTVPASISFPLCTLVFTTSQCEKMVSRLKTTSVSQPTFRTTWRKTFDCYLEPSQNPSLLQRTRLTSTL